ncbi:MAG TPA: HNH endonuclease, partial [Anaeromyxobacteraceae bacterium]|nr:HNH endonuclease [Anaeromyxobacteraceae bacterium]
MSTARALASRLLDLLRREQSAMADFLVALADFDRRRAWEDLGHTSLFVFLHREAGLSKGASHFRKVAAELIQRFPEVVEPLRDGRLCITSVVELAKVITPENRAEVLPRFFHASKSEAKAISAEIRPLEAAPHRMVVTAPSTPAAPRMAVAQA